MLQAIRDTHRYSPGELRTALRFLAPLGLLIGIFVLLPVLGTLAGSLYLDTTFLERRFAWFDNYCGLLTDHTFLQSAWFTLTFAAVSVPLELALGLALALLMNSQVRPLGLLRACVLIPWAIPGAISARTWELIYNYNYGLANALLGGLGIVGEPVNWLGTGAGAFAALVLTDVWRTTPFVAIILLTGLQAIPVELYQQAQVDQAGALGRLRRITLPLLRPIIIVALLFRTIDAVRVFDIIYILTRGGPGGSTTSLSLYAYRNFLGGDFGYGSAASALLFVVALGLSLVYIKMARKLKIKMR